MTNVAVIGAGPSGTTAAKLLAKSGFKVSIFEEHKNIGKPIQCAGIVTETLFNFVKKGSYIVNELNEVEIISQKNKTIIPLNEYVICRESFDKQLAEEAEQKGSNILTSHKFIDIKKDILRISHINKILKISFQKLIMN